MKALYPLALVAILALSTPVSGLAQTPVTCHGVLSEQQLTTLVTERLPDPRVHQFIKQCGIGFELTDWAERRSLRAVATAKTEKRAAGSPRR